MSKGKTKGSQRLIEAMQDPSAGGIFYIYGSNWFAQLELLKKVQELATKPEFAAFDLAEISDVRKIGEHRLAEVFDRVPNGERMVVIIYCADKMTVGQRSDYASLSPFFLEQTLIILVNTPHTKMDPDLVRLQDAVEVVIN